MKKIDKEKSVVYSNYSDPDSLCIRGTFVDDFDYPDSYFEGTLCGIRANAERTFLNTYGNWYKYFVPESTRVLVEEPKKLRPFKDMREFFDTTGFDIGQIVHIKKDVGIEFEETTIFNGYRTDTDNTFIIFGFQAHDFEQLMEFFKFYRDGKWCPFGVEE